MPIDLYCGCGRALHDYRERVTGECTYCQSRYAPVHVPVAVQVERQSDDDDAPPQDEPVDPVTRRLIDDALKTHGKNECPKCWHLGKFIRMALVCPKHGVFGGV